MPDWSDEQYQHEMYQEYLRERQRQYEEEQYDRYLEEQMYFEELRKDMEEHPLFFWKVTCRRDNEV